MPAPPHDGHNNVAGGRELGRSAVDEALLDLIRATRQLLDALESVIEHPGGVEEMVRRARVVFGERSAGYAHRPDEDPPPDYQEIPVT